jgi:hypothetical protein
MSWSVIGGRVSGIVYGEFVPCLRRNIYFGECVGDVCRLVFSSVSVLWIVRRVWKWWRMIDIFFFRLWGEQKCLGWSGSWYFHWGYVMDDICNKEDDTVTYRIALVEWVMRKWGTIVTIGFGTMPRTRPMGVLWVLYITGLSGMLRTTYNNAPLLLLMVGESAMLM